MVFPIAALVDVCRDRGVAVVVDGAHAPGLIDEPAADGADFWTGNFHKWPASPRATAGLVVAEQWRYGDAAADRVVVGVRRAPAGAVRHAGHVRLLPWIAAPESLRVLDELDWPVRRAQLSDLLDEGARVVAKALGTGVAEVARPAATMRLVELRSTVDLTAAEALKTRCPAT